MASIFTRVQSARSTRSGTRCSVCLDEARNPTRLTCDHKYCQGCLRDQFTKLASVNLSVDKVSIVCPYCRDYFLSSIEYLNDKTKAPKSARSSVARRPLSARPVDDGKSQRCQPCSEGSHYETSSFWCQNCSEYLCSTCAKYHKSMKMSKMHVVKTIKDKERYGQIKSKVGELVEYKPKAVVSNLFHQNVGFWCDPCGETKKRNEAKHWCEICKEKFCSDCCKCHKSMKMSKSHTIMSMKEVVSRSETKYSLDVECERHHGEILGMYCKRCQLSCCGLCAVTVHDKCGAALKSAMKQNGVAKVMASTILDRSDYQQADKTKKIVSIDDKKKSFTYADKSKVETTEKKKTYIQKNRMENRKSRINFGSVTAGDWVISLVVLNSGDILFIELYQNELKLMTNAGEMVSTCSFYGDPWSVAVYNDSLAVVTFSDRKQLQLINITRYGLEAGKRINTRHKSLSVCFTKDLIVTSCWEGCIHILNIVGNELSSIDKDHNGYKLFTNPEYIAADRKGTIVYVSDYKQNTVTALKLLPNRIDNKPAWVFKNTELEGPKGIAVDTNGVTYVSGMSSRNIFRLSPEGEVIQIYRRRDDRDNYEALALSPFGDKIYASAYEDDTIIVFSLSKL